MGGKIAQEKWETERSNRKESIRSINNAQYFSDGGGLDNYYYQRCKKCRKKNWCKEIEGKWLCMTCRSRA